MTSPRLKAALAEWEQDMACDGAVSDRVAYQLLAAIEAEPQERFDVGQAVKVQGIGDVRAVAAVSEPQYALEGYKGWYLESSLEPIPNTPESECYCEGNTFCPKHLPRDASTGFPLGPAAPEPDVRLNEIEDRLDGLDEDVAMLINQRKPTPVSELTKMAQEHGEWDAIGPKMTIGEALEREEE